MHGPHLAPTLHRVTPKKWDRSAADELDGQEEQRRFASETRAKSKVRRVRARQGSSPPKQTTPRHGSGGSPPPRAAQGNAGPEERPLLLPPASRDQAASCGGMAGSAGSGRGNPRRGRIRARRRRGGGGVGDWRGLDSLLMITE